MKAIFVVVWIVIVAVTSHAQVFTGEDSNEPFTIHGRLSNYNGSALRIWIVGSKRMLSVAGETTHALDRVNEFFGDGDGWFSREIYADFTVEPLAADIKGHMRPVRILSIKQLVITRDGRFLAKRDEL